MLRMLKKKREEWKQLNQRIDEHIRQEMIRVGLERLGDKDSNQHEEFSASLVSLVSVTVKRKNLGAKEKALLKLNPLKSELETVTLGVRELEMLGRMEMAERGRLFLEEMEEVKLRKQCFPKVLVTLLPKGKQEYICGDLGEEFEERRQKCEKAAARWCRSQMIRSVVYLRIWEPLCTQWGKLSGAVNSIVSGK